MALGKIGAREKVLLLPPDITRLMSKAGELASVKRLLTVSVHLPAHSASINRDLLPSSNMWKTNRGAPLRARAGPASQGRWCTGQRRHDSR